MRPIDADALKDKLQQHHDFWVMAWGGFSKMPISDKKRVDEITNCIAEVVNAPTIDAVSKWIPFEIRPTDDEERECFKSDTILCGELPDDDDEILVSKGKHVWVDTFASDELGVWLDSYGEIEEGMAWMPLPKPYGERKESE